MIKAGPQGTFDAMVLWQGKDLIQEGHVYPTALHGYELLVGTVRLGHQEAVDLFQFAFPGAIFQIVYFLQDQQGRPGDPEGSCALTIPVGRPW